MAGYVAFIRGGGELGTGAGCALHRAGLRLVVIELPLPHTLRHGVAFSASATEGRAVVAGVEAVRCDSVEHIEEAWAAGRVAVWAKPEAELDVAADVLVDARMRQLSAPLTTMDDAAVVVGIGPGFEVGRDAHYVIESNRGPRLGQVIAAGRAEEHTGVPGQVAGYREERVLRAPRAGRFARRLGLGDFVEIGDEVGSVEEEPVFSRLRGMIRGLKLTGVHVGVNHKVGDVDPRRDRALLQTMTDKARAVGRGAVEALKLAGLLEPSVATTAGQQEENGRCT